MTHHWGKEKMRCPRPPPRTPPWPAARRRRARPGCPRAPRPRRRERPPPARRRRGQPLFFPSLSPFLICSSSKDPECWRVTAHRDLSTRARGSSSKCLEGAAVLPTDRDPVRVCLPRAAQALLKFWQAASRSGAGQEHYGAARRSPTHPSVDIARPGRAAGPRAPGATSEHQHFRRGRGDT